MFTGIIEEIGTIYNLAHKEDIQQYRIVVSTDFIKGIQLGDSVSVNGIC